MRVFLTSILLSSGMFMSLFSQGTQYLIALKVDAREYFHTQQYGKALDVYLKLDSLEPNVANHYYHIGACYMNMNHPEEAITYLRSCQDKSNELPNSYNFYMAKAYHELTLPDSAISYYKEYLKNVSPKGRANKSIITDIRKEIASCEYAKKMIANPIEGIEVFNIGKPINSTYPEHSSVISADDQIIIFTSERPDTKGGKKYAFDGTYYEDLYISYNNDGKWTEPVSLSDNINTDHQDASVFLTSDGHTLIIYRYSPDNKLGHNSGQLFTSEYNGKEWEEPVALPHPINSKYWESSACFSAEGEYIYFTSNRKGGYGGTDIYKSQHLEDGSWSKPKNLGPTINTKYDETSPFLHPNGKTLYFSSNGHQSMGGFDIFSSTYDAKMNQWSNPTNIGYPINTTNDDVDFSLSPDGRHIYFSDHRRNSIGEKDIYHAIVHETPQDLTLIKGTIRDAKTNNPIPSTVKLKKDDGPAVMSIHNAKGDHHYTLVMRKGHTYTVLIESEGYQPYKRVVNTDNFIGFKQRSEDIFLSKK